MRKLLEVLHRLVEQGNSVMVIEHNLDVIKTADHVLDLGPGGGVRGVRLWRRARRRKWLRSTAVIRARSQADAGEAARGGGVTEPLATA